MPSLVFSTSALRSKQMHLRSKDEAAEKALWVKCELWEHGDLHSDPHPWARLCVALQVHVTPTLKKEVKEIANLAAF